MDSLHTANPSASTSVGEGLERYLSENGFDRSGYTAPTFTVTVGPFDFKFPNVPARQRAIALHDLHHVVTGYGTDLAGESEIGAWELRAGCNTGFLWFINLAAVFGGLFVAPIRTFHAFRRARGARSLYVQGVQPADVSELTVGELRLRSGVQPEGANDRARHLHRHAATVSPATR